MGFARKVSSDEVSLLQFMAVDLVSSKCFTFSLFLILFYFSGKILRGERERERRNESNKVN